MEFSLYVEDHEVYFDVAKKLKELGFKFIFDFEDLSDPMTYFKVAIDQREHAPKIEITFLEQLLELSLKFKGRFKIDARDNSIIFDI